MKGIQTYLLTVSATAILVSLFSGLVSDEKIKNTAVYAGGLVLILTMLAPVMKIDGKMLEQALNRLEQTLETFQADSVKQSGILYASRIKQQAEEYILDKTADMGIAVTVDVTVCDDGNLPVPVAASVKGSLTELQKDQIADLLEHDLGIKREAQSWESS